VLLVQDNSGLVLTCTCDTTPATLLSYFLELIANCPLSPITITVPGSTFLDSARSNSSSQSALVRMKKFNEANKKSELPGTGFSVLRARTSTCVTVFRCPGSKTDSDQVSSSNPNNTLLFGLYCSITEVSKNLLINFLSVCYLPVNEMAQVLRPVELGGLSIIMLIGIVALTTEITEYEEVAKIVVIPSMILLIIVTGYAIFKTACRSK